MVIHGCQYGGKNAIPILDLLYSDSNVYLNRKYKTFKEVMPNEYRLHSC